MEMHQVRYFLTVCDTLNFTRAADRCNVAQPSLTRAIKKLEDELGGLLFCRERASTHLTKLGRLMKPHLQQIHEATHAARSDASSYQELDLAPLQIGVMASLSPKRFVGFFKSIKDDIRALDLKLTVAPAGGIIEAMARGDIDVAFLEPTDLPERFVARAVFDEPYVLACPQTHMLACNQVVPVSALVEQRCLVSSDFLESEAAALFPNGICSGHDDSGWTQAAALRENCCALVPRSSSPIEGVVIRPVATPAPTRTISIVTLAGRHHAPAVDHTVKAARRYCWAESIAVVGNSRSAGWQSTPETLVLAA